MREVWRRMCVRGVEVHECEGVWRHMCVRGVEVHVCERVWRRMCVRGVWRCMSVKGCGGVCV